MLLLKCAVSAVLVETVTSAIAIPQSGPVLRAWYREFGTAAVAMDLLSLCLGVYAGRKLAKTIGVDEGLLGQMCCVLFVQVLHDVSFGALLSHLPHSNVLDAFRDYKARKGLRILLDDALMVSATALLLYSCSSSLDKEGAIAVALVALYANLIIVL